MTSGTAAVVTCVDPLFSWIRLEITAVTGLTEGVKVNTADDPLDTSPARITSEVFRGAYTAGNMGDTECGSSGSGTCSGLGVAASGPPINGGENNRDALIFRFVDVATGTTSTNIDVRSIRLLFQGINQTGAEDVDFFFEFMNNADGFNLGNGSDFGALRSGGGGAGNIPRNSSSFIDFGNTSLFTTSQIPAGRTVGMFAVKIESHEGFLVSGIEFDPGPNPIPEPSACLLSVAGLLGVAVLRRARRRRSGRS